MPDYYGVVRHEKSVGSCSQKKLQLTPEIYTSSRELRTWCKQNRNRCYVPEWLLEEWGITVDPYFTGAA